eukprot:767880-Hanusia_phi.AAC.10
MQGPEKTVTAGMADVWNGAPLLLESFDCVNHFLGRDRGLLGHSALELEGRTHCPRSGRSCRRE